MRTRTFSFFFILGACFVLAAGCREASAPATDNTVSEIWRLVSVSRFTEANEQFERLARSRHLDAETREEARFGQAVTLLEVQPKTNTNVETARAMLRELSENAGSDDIAASALYYLGRVYELHADQPDRERAHEIYHRLIEGYPDHPLAEDAVVNVVTQELWYRVDGDPSADRVREMEGWLERVKRSNSRADLHLVLGDAWLRNGSGSAIASALPHYRAVLDWSGLPISTRADVLCIVGNLARELERYDEAIDAFETFLEENPYNSRVTLVRDALKAIHSKNDER